MKDELAALVAEHPDLEPADSPLGKVNAPSELTGPTVRHARPMLSLAKATTEEQVRAFCERFPGRVFRVSEKLDGLSLSIVYTDGKLDYVATRGTGAVGELVTEKVAPRDPRPARRGGRRRPGRGARRGGNAAVGLAGLQRGPSRQDPHQPAQRRGRDADAEGPEGRGRRAPAAALRRVRGRARRGRDRVRVARRHRGRGDHRLRRRRRGDRRGRGDRRAPRRARLRGRRRGRPPARARGVRGGRVQRRRAARRDRVQVPARGAHDQAAGGRVAGRQDRARPASRARRAGVRRRRDRREHHAPQPAADPRARPADRRHRRGRPPRRRDPVRRPGDRRGPRRVRGGDRPADPLPVVRVRARDPRHGRGALVREPPVPRAGDPAADALGIARGRRHGGRRRRVDREARRRRRAQAAQRLLPADHRAADRLRADGGGVGAQHRRRDPGVQGDRPAPRADRAGDPDGIRRRRQAAVPGRLRAHRGGDGRDRGGPGRDPRHRPEGRRVGRLVLRPRGRSRRGARPARAGRRAGRARRGPARGRRPRPRTRR